MIDYDDLARAARYNDAEAEEVGLDGWCQRHGIDLTDLLRMAEQRALRIAYMSDGRDPTKLPRDKPVPVPLSARARKQMSLFQSAVIDGFAIGVQSRHDSSHDIPGIDPNPRED